MPIFLLLILIAHANVPAQTTGVNDAIVDKVVSEAMEMGIQNQVGWRKLGHWRDTWRGPVSTADGTDFFLASNGKTDPSAELEATLRGFFRPPSESELRGNQVRQSENPDDIPLQHPVCRFPARLIYLSKQLNLDPRSLAVTECPKLDEFLARSSPSGASIVFSSYYLQNPASIFGHTFLRIHRRADADGQADPSLTDDGVNFGAVVGDEGGIKYIFKGVVGLYPGRFSRQGYHYKVREYNDFESRDLWEYQLNLTPEENWFLVAHIWELDNTHFDYFFRTENCSYQLVALLEAIRPELDLLPAHWRSVTPIDTIRALLSVEGLVKERVWRPSLRKQFLKRVQPMDKEQQKVVGNLVRDPDIPMPEAWGPDKRAATFDAAADLVEVRYPKQIVQQMIEDIPTPASSKKQRILERRADIAVKSPQLDNTPLPLAIPTDGHSTHRAAIGTGLSDEGDGFSRIQVRAALHDLGDPPTGYPELEQIQFFPASLRINGGDDGSDATPNIVLEHLSLVQIRSIQPLRRFGRGLSMEVRGGLESMEAFGHEKCIAGRLRTGSGGALATPGNGVVWYALGNMDALIAPNNQGVLDSPLMLGVGASSGLRFRPHPRLVAFGSGEITWYPEQLATPVWSTQARIVWSATRTLAFGTEGRKHPHRTEASLNGYWFF